MISSKDISVVVQGAVDYKNTPKCLASIRKYLPNSEIILSTWEGANYKGLDYDAILLNKDPGSFKMSPYETNNVKRQIVSTLEGLKKCTRKYAQKIRSDISLTGNGFTKYLDKFDSYNEDWHFLKSRIIVCSFFTRNPVFSEWPMHPSDWCSFGLIEDMLTLWNIALPTKEEENWFKYHRKDDLVKKYYYPLVARYNPEQFIWINFVKKFKKVSTEHMFDKTQNSINETLLSFANNLIIITDKQYNIKFLKKHRNNCDLWQVTTYNDFLKIFNMYANGNVEIPMIDLSRLYLFRHYFDSFKRRYRLACFSDKVPLFVEKELKAISQLFT